MKYLPVFCLFLTIDASTAGSPAGKEPAPTTALAPRSRWSVSAGVRVRRFSADFNVAPIGLLNLPFSRIGAVPGGSGDVGIFLGGTGQVVYDDGAVGPAYGTQPGDFGPDGSAYGRISSESQISPTGRFDSTGDEIFDLTFHSSGTTGESSSVLDEMGFSDSDSALAASPWVELRYLFMERPRWSLSVMAGYSWARAALASREGVLGSLSDINTVVSAEYAYTYDHYAFNSGAAGGDFPFQDTHSATIFDATRANAPSGYTENSNDSRAPRKTFTSGGAVGSSTGGRALLAARGRASVNISLHELVMAPELEWHAAPRLDVHLAVGPTINFVETDTTATGGWYDGARKVRSISARDSDSSVEIGVLAELGVRYAFNSNWYLDLSGGYRYVPTVEVRAGFARAEADASSWTAGLGVGYRF